MPKTKHKPSSSYPKLSRLDKNIISATKALENPTKATIAKHVVELGGAKHIQTVYKRLKKSDYLSRDLSEIDSQHHQQLVREDYPLARKRLAKALKDKELTHKEAFPFVKLAYDKVHGETFKNMPAAGVSIGAIQNAQFIIQGDVDQVDSQEPEKP